MRERILKTLLTTAVCVMMFGTTALAYCKEMPDGSYFDAEYYAKNNPDVVAAFGTDENALYQHYVQAGKAEGRFATEYEYVRAIYNYYMEGDKYKALAIELPREYMCYPDIKEFDDRGKLHAYMDQCEVDMMVKYANGTLLRLQPGTIIKIKSNDRYTAGYTMVALYDGDWRGDRYYYVLNDKLLEYINEVGIEEATQEVCSLGFVINTLYDPYMDW